MRARTRACLVGAFGAVALVAAACGSGGPTVASLGSQASKSTSTTTAASKHTSALAYSECMRSHGIGDFPDPNSQGQIALSAGPGSDLDPNNPTFQAAQNACQSLMPNGGKPSAAQIAQAKQNALKFSQCMRSHGVKDFPDPTFSNGGAGIKISAGGQSSDLNPDNPTFQSAQQACAKDLHLPTPAGGEVKTNGNGNTSGSGSSGQVVIGG